MARNGLPSRSTIVGLSVVRGRFPPATTLGCPASRTNACMRFPSGTPVSPAMYVPPANHADDGEAENRFPFASATSMVVVSGDGPLSLDDESARASGRTARGLDPG